MRGRQKNVKAPAPAYYRLPAARRGAAVLQRCSECQRSLCLIAFLTWMREQPLLQSPLRAPPRPAAGQLRTRGPALSILAVRTWSGRPHASPRPAPHPRT